MSHSDDDASKNRSYLIQMVYGFSIYNASLNVRPLNGLRRRETILSAIVVFGRDDDIKAMSHSYCEPENTFADGPSPLLPPIHLSR